MAALPSTASAAADMVKLQSGSTAGAENYLFTSGDGVTGAGTVASGAHYRMVVYDPDGWIRGLGSCSTAPTGAGTQAVSTTFTLSASHPASDTQGWRYALFEYSDVFCSNSTSSDSLYFANVKLNSYADSAMTTAKTTFAPGSTVYTRGRGLGPFKSSASNTATADWNVSWIDPSGNTVCENTLGADRGDTSSAGDLPGVTSPLQYRPGVGGSGWNQESNYDSPCTDLTTSNQGVWKVKLWRTTDAFHTVTLPAFTNSDVPADASIDASPVSPGTDTTPTWTISSPVGTTAEYRLDKGAAEIAGWTTCSGATTYNIGPDGDGTYTFSVRSISPGGTRGNTITSTYELNGSAPPAPTIGSTPSSPDDDTTPTWSFSGGAGETFECRLELDGVGFAPYATYGSCTSAATFTLGADGAYTFYVRAISSGGTPGPASTSSYTLDTTAPAAPVIDVNPGAVGTDRTPTWEFSGEAGAGFECQLEHDLSTVYTFTACSSPHTEDLSSAVDGDYKLSVRAVDAAGNAGPAASHTYTLDATALAAPTIHTAPPSPDDSRNPSWTFSGSGVSFQCRLDGPSGEVYAWVSNCTSAHSFSLAALADGDYTFSVRGVSAGGTPGAAATDTYTLDTTAPVAPNITTPPPAVGNSRAPEWAYTGEAGATLECRLDEGTLPLPAFGSCPSPHVASLIGKPDGPYTLAVRAVDVAGNISAEATSTYQLDTTAPDAPLVDAPPLSNTNNAQPSFSFATQAESTYACRLTGGDGSAATWTPCTTPASYNLTSQLDGAFTFEVRETDAAGNTGAPRSVVWQLDRAGAIVRIDSAPGPIGNLRAPAWSFSSEVGAVYECSLDPGAGSVFARSGCGAPRSYDLTARPDGVYTFSVWAADIAGNTGAPAIHTYELDTVAPAKPTMGAPPASPSRDRSPSWTFTGEAGAALECRVERDGVAVRDWESCASPRGYDLRGQDDGAYRFLVRARDAATNLSERAADNYRLDTTAPAAPTIERAPRASTDDVSPSWSFAGEEDAVFECALGRGDETIERWESCRSPKTYNLSNRRTATYTFSVRATDRAGNTGRSRSDDYALSAAAANPPSPADPTPTAPTPVPTASPPAPAAPTPPDPGVSEDAPTPGDAGGKGDGDSKDGLAGAAPGDDPTTGGPGSAEGAGSDAGATAEGGSGGAEKAEPKRSGAAAAAHAVTQAVGKAVEVVAKNADKSVFPFSLVMIVFVFLGIQGRIDRSDPKLALAPLHADPDLEFFPPPTEA